MTSKRTQVLASKGEGTSRLAGAAPRGHTRREVMVQGARTAAMIISGPSLVSLIGCASPETEPWADGSFWADGTGWIV